MVMEKKKRAIGYIRVSTTAQDAARQRLQIEDFCRDNGYSLNDVLKDEGISQEQTKLPETPDFDC